MALTDHELGVTDMDRVTNKGRLDGPMSNSAQQLLRAVNSGAAGTWMHRN
ncbi:hypothetical protein ACFQT4_11255 [Pseudoduganella danionis]